VANSELAKLIGLAPETIAYAVPFFADIGILERSKDGTCIPCEELMAFHRALDWTPETAMHKLGPVFERAWFAGVLLPILRFRSLLEDEALAQLAENSAAGGDYKPQLRMILDLLETTGVIERENGSIRLRRSSSTPANDPAPTKQSEMPAAVFETGAASASFGGAPQTIPAARTSEGALNLAIDIRVEMAELAKWEPDRITAFLGGIAQVLSAQKRSTVPDGK
jgi:hypothetical protein